MYRKFSILLLTLGLAACLDLSPDPKGTFEREIRPLLDRSDLKAEKLNSELLVGSLCFLAAYTFQIPINYEAGPYEEALLLEPTTYDGRVNMANQDIGQYVEQAGFSWSEIVPGAFHGTKDGPMFPELRQRLYPNVTAYSSKVKYVRYVFIDMERRSVLLIYFSGCAG